MLILPCKFACEHTCASWALLVLQSSVSVLPTLSCMGNHLLKMVILFFPRSVSTQISWLCFNVLQMHLMKHLWSLNMHPELSSKTHSPPIMLLCLHIRRLFLLVISTTFSVGAVSYMYTSKSACSLDWQKERFAHVSDKKVFWFNNCHRFQSRAEIPEKSKVVEMEHCSSNNLALTEFVFFTVSEMK